MHLNTDERGGGTYRLPLGLSLARALARLGSLLLVSLEADVLGFLPLHVEHLLVRKVVLYYEFEPAVLTLEHTLGLMVVRSDLLAGYAVRVVPDVVARRVE